ncbi:MAG: ATP-grasp domain-containing protein [Phycisphaerae bacterium]|nr:ATP-grasp domain-containing protein [Phycisphaerae bacterium]
MSGASSRLRVLILDSGRQALPFMRSLKTAKHHVAVACGSKFSPCYFSRYPDRRLLWANYFEDPDTFTEQMFRYIRRYRPDVTIPVGDVSAGIVARNKQELLKYTRVTVPELKVFDRAADKAKTMAFCMENDIPCPKTFFPDEENLEDIVVKTPFPVMVKPRRGIGAIGLHRFEGPDELRRHFGALRERYGELLIQEFIPLEGGTQFQAEAFLDADSRMKVCMVIAKPRFFPVTGGTSTANVTIHRPDIQENVRRLLEGIGWIGAADVDLMLDPRDNVPKILEINPRVTAGIKIGFAAGIDYADLHIRLALGQSIPKIDSYKLGVYSRNLCMDILWYLFSEKKARRSAWPPFFKFFGKSVCYQTFDLYDLMPLAGFILGMLKKYASPAVWKKKLGRDLD